MLISVNRTIIDTKRIYKINNISFNLMSFKFKIHFNNVNCLEILKCVNYETIDEIKLKITEFRNSIIKIWQENKSEIPQFNLK